MSDNIPDDIALKAIEVAKAIGAGVDSSPIALALLAERQACQKEIDNWRDKWRVESFSHDANHAVAELCREWSKQIVGINATWVDDDLRVLAHLADLAVQYGLTNGLNQECQAAIAAQARSRRGED